MKVHALDLCSQFEKSYFYPPAIRDNEFMQREMSPLIMLIIVTAQRGAY